MHPIENPDLSENLGKTNIKKNEIIEMALQYEET